MPTQVKLPIRAGDKGWVGAKSKKPTKAEKKAVLDAVFEPLEEAPEIRWAVMKALCWSDVITNFNLPLKAPQDGPQHFIPVFDTREQALKFTNGNPDRIATLQLTTPAL